MKKSKNKFLNKQSSFVIIISVICMCFNITINAQSVIEDWSKQYGTASADVLSSLQETNDGGYIAAGQTGGTVTNGINLGSNDGWILKTNILGVQEWSKQYGSTQDDKLYKIIETSDGGYLGVGRTRGNVTNGTLKGVLDGWMIKVDANGVQQWSKQYGSNLSDALYAVYQTSDGGFVAVGSTAGSVTNGTNKGNTDGWMIKVDANGVEQWSRQYGTPSQEELYSVLQTDDGEYIASFYTFGSVTNGANLGGTDGWVLKVDGSGFEQWSKQYGSTGNDNLTEIVKSNDGGYVATGTTTGSVTNGVNLGGSDGWILKIDDNGNEVWSKQYGNAQGNALNSIDNSNMTHYILAGVTSGTVANGTPVGGQDGWVMLIDNQGTEIWSKQYGSTGTDALSAVKSLNDFYYVAAGNASNSVTNGTHIGGDDGWIIKMQATFDLTFDLNTGDGVAPAVQTLTYNSISTPVTPPTKAGYVFIGWNTVQNGSGSTWDFSTSTMPGNDTTLYAQWVIDSFEVSFNLNGGNGTAPTTQTLSYNSLVAPVNNPTKIGHSFLYWNSEVNGSGITWDFSSTKMPANDVTLYAQWSINQYELSFNLNGGEGAAPASQDLDFDTLATQPQPPIRTGYTFNGWNTQQDSTGITWDFAVDRMPDNNMVLYAQWSINQHELSFNLNGGEGIAPASQDLDFDTLATQPQPPIRTGYTFNSWNTQQDGTGITWDFAVDRMPDNNMVLYAQWSINQYELSFNLNGGEGTAPVSQDLDFGTLATQPQSPIRAGYTFNGWNESADGSGASWDFSNTTMPDNNVTLYAQWLINQYELSFNLNGGEGTAPASQDLDFGMLATQPQPPIREGYTFNGWNTQQGGAGITWDFTVDRMPDNNIVLYAQWEKNVDPIVEYTLRFDLNGGQGVAPTNQILNEGQKASKPTSPSREEYVFKGWNTTKDGRGTIWDFETNTMPANDVTLYAQWSKQNLPVTGESSNAISLSSLLVLAGAMVIVINKRRILK